MRAGVVVLLRQVPGAELRRDPAGNAARVPNSAGVVLNDSGGVVLKEFGRTMSPRVEIRSPVPADERVPAEVCVPRVIPPLVTTPLVIPEVCVPAPRGR